MTKEVRNILRVYRMATTEEYISGTVWYTVANLEANEISIKHNVPIHIVVGVIAALSPNNKWSRNLRDADKLIHTYLSGGTPEMCKPSTYTKMRDKAWSIMTDYPSSVEGVEKILNGQKIVSFFRNIMGIDSVTVDGHAYNIARGKRASLTDNDTNMSKTVYQEMQAAYRRAAKRVNLKVYELQAITWLVWKRLHNI